MQKDIHAAQWLESLDPVGIRLGLERMRELLRRIGNPEKTLRFLHVAGSNGKGSVCALLEEAFRHAGYRTGFYSSPHLILPNERFRINGESCPDDLLDKAAERLYPAAADMKARGNPVTYFEAATALALLLFEQEKVGIVLWETGMGGRLDATNVVTPIASVITGISLEHKQFLGNTLAEIGGEKAGIIKPGCPVFCSRTTPEEALRVIRKRAEDLHAPFHLSPELSEEPPVLHPPDAEGGFLQTFRLKDGTELSTALAGPHQRRNAALARAVLGFCGTELGFDADKAAEAFREVRWDARLQFVPGKNLLIDGGHNPEGIGALADALRELYPGKKFHFLFGAFSDKDTAASLARLAPLAESFTFLPMETERESRSGEFLGAQLAACAPDVPWEKKTLTEALSGIRPHTVLCGSLHLCGDALAILKNGCIV